MRSTSGATSTASAPELLHRRVGLDLSSVRAFCRRWRVVELAVYGSVLRDDFTAASDVDFLYRAAQDADVTLLDEVHMEEALRALVGRPVDLVSRAAVEHSSNWIRRRHILESARPVYVEG